MPEETDGCFPYMGDYVRGSGMEEVVLICGRLSPEPVTPRGWPKEILLCFKEAGQNALFGIQLPVIIIAASAQIAYAKLRAGLQNRTPQ